MDDQNPRSELSARKMQANRENAQKSTGPRTAQGKRASSGNAKKHGLLSKELVIPDRESLEEFEQLLEELIEHHQPENRAELSLVETAAISDWRFRRSLYAEKSEILDTLPGDPMAFARVLPSADELSKILRYQTTIHRQKMQVLQLLEKLQQRRRNSQPTSASNELDAEEK